MQNTRKKHENARRVGFHVEIWKNKNLIFRRNVQVRCAVIVSRPSASFEGRTREMRPAGGPHKPGSCASTKCVRRSAENVPSICMGEWVGVKYVFSNRLDLWMHRTSTRRLLFRPFRCSNFCRVYRENPCVVRQRKSRTIELVLSGSVRF